MKTIIQTTLTILSACAFFVLTGCGGAGISTMGVHSDYFINHTHEAIARGKCRRMASLSEYTDTLNTETYGNCMKAAGYACMRDFETNCFFTTLNDIRCHGEHTDGFRCKRTTPIPDAFKECFVKRVKVWSGGYYTDQARPCYSLK